VRHPDGQRIRAAIDAAELGTTGRIGVRIVHGKTADALDEARRHFAAARLHEHEQRNAVVFFVAPAARRFAVFGDVALHERVGEEFWQRLVGDMQPFFARGDMTEGLAMGIARVGEQLRHHFPVMVSA
jgi:uncharacterized membrane protein